MIRFGQRPRSCPGWQNKSFWVTYQQQPASTERLFVLQAVSKSKGQSHALWAASEFKVQDFKCWATNHNVQVLISSQYRVVPSCHTPSPRAWPAPGAAGLWSPGSFPRHYHWAQQSCEVKPAASLCHRPWGPHARLVQMEIPIPTILASGVESFRIMLHRFQPLWLFQKGLAFQ